MVKVTMNGRHEVKRVQIEPAVLGEDREMLEDLIAAAVNDAVHKVEARIAGEDGERHRRHAAAAGYEAAVLSCDEALPAPGAPDRCAARACPGSGPKSAQRMAFHLLQDGRPGAQALAEALDARRWSRCTRCRRCRMLTEDELCSICAAAAARRGAAVRGGVARRRGRDRALRQLPRALLRADGAPVAARWRGPGAAGRARARGDAGRGRRARTHPRHQLRPSRARRPRTS